MGFASLYKHLHMSPIRLRSSFYQVSGVESHSLVFSTLYIHSKSTLFPYFSSAGLFAMMRKGFWKTVPGPRLLKLITAVSAVAISYEGMSQGVIGAVNVAPEYGV
jgi:hypothetical protein